MKHYKHFLSVVTVLLGAMALNAQTIRYVKQGGTGAGTSWDDASEDIQAMLSASAANDEVWVAAGEYTANNLVQPNDVKLYGGFPAEGDPVITDRDWAANITILNSAYYGMYFSGGQGGGTVVDGFTVAGGNTVFVMLSSSPTLRNLIIKNNVYSIYAYNSGTHIYNTLITGSVDGFYLSLSNLVITNVTAVGSSEFDIYTDSPMTIINSIIGTYNDSWFFAMYNSIFGGNVMFTDAANGDYTLQPGSPAINAGNTDLFTDAATSKDLAGNPRLHSSSIDAGAYEYGISTVRYVRTVASGLADGSGWENASNDIAAMMALSIGDDEIWVAAGNYTVNAIDHKNGVKLYGGFPATGEPTIADRDWAANTATLDGSASAQAVNYYGGQTNATVLDGFTVQAPAMAVYCTNASPVFRNLILKTTASAGTGLALVASDATVANCLITQTVNGLDINGGAPTLVNLTIAGNDGFDIHALTSYTLANSIAETVNDTALLTSVNSLTGTDALFTDAANGNFNLMPGSPAIDSGDTALFTDAGTAKDITGSLRLNGAAIDMGAYEYNGPAACGIMTTWMGTAWTNGIPADDTFAAYINGDFNSAADSAISACSLTIYNGAVTVAAGDNLMIKGAINVIGGSLTFEDNANLLQEDDAANTGNITYKKESSALSDPDYTLWASPVNGAQSLKQFSPETEDAHFYVYSTATDEYNNYENGSGIFDGNPGDGIDHTPEEVIFTTAKGYLVRMPDGWTGPAAFEGTFTGIPNNGPITTPLATGGNRYNAVGNPYPSPINITDLISENSANLDNGTIYFWRKANGSSNTAYATINKAAYVAAANGAGDTGAGFFEDGQENQWVINPGQGFMVQANATADGLDFNNAMRRALNNGQFFRMGGNTATPPPPFIASKLWLDITNEAGDFGQTAIVYSDVTTLALDYGYDGMLFNDGTISAYTIAEAAKLTIQARAEFTDTDEVDFGYKATTAGDYTISVGHVTGVFEEGQDIYLRDNDLDITHNLTEGNYTFTTGAGSFSDRFDIVYVEALGTGNPVLDANSIIIYSKNNVITINCGNALLEDIAIYDIRGRLLYSNKGINASEFAVSDLKPQQQVLIIRAATADGQTISRKIIF